MRRNPKVVTTQTQRLNPCLLLVQRVGGAQALYDLPTVQWAEPVDSENLIQRVPLRHIGAGASGTPMPV
jgi:hypothetical protein